MALLFSLTLVLAPSLAEARAGSSLGGGFSGMGSRGSRSFENNGAAPLSRSMETPAPAIGGGYGAYGGGGFFSRHPFLTGMFGGFIGSMLFGGGMFGHMFGGLFSILIIGLVIYLLFRLLSGAFAGGGSGLAPRSVGAAAAPAQQRYRGRDITVSDADLAAFQSLHAAIQEAWGRSDLGQMRQLMTPEMLSYFSEELTRNSSQGVENHVSNVNLIKAELAESWEEGDLQYATAYMRWTALDYTARIGAAPSSPGAVVTGDPRVPTESEEVWTFVRRSGGHWLLSAIQQV
ncbi:MAG TPA: TIM44-like domain-containing protein [Stellaceae bacterium]|nr:TIM44-like domain-containing protein [Stellaceae bacterium]